MLCCYPFGSHFWKKQQVCRCPKHIYICSGQGSKWNGGGPVWHTGTSLADWKAYRGITGTSFLRKVIPVCFAGHFVRFRQLVADVCIDQWPK